MFLAGFHFLWLLKFQNTGQSLLSQKKFLKPEKVVDEDGKVIKKKTAIIPKIKLIDTNGNLTSVTLEEADKIAKRRRLSLVMISDASPNGAIRAVYELKSSEVFLKFQFPGRGMCLQSSNNFFCFSCLFS